MQSFYDSLSLDGIAHCSRYKLSRVDIWLPPLAINFPTPLVKLFVSRPSFTRNPSRTGGYRFEILTVSDREFSRIDTRFSAPIINLSTPRIGFSPFWPTQLALPHQEHARHLRTNHRLQILAADLIGGLAFPQNYRFSPRSQIL